jgi:hypothetical protein
MTDTTETRIGDGPDEMTMLPILTRPNDPDLLGPTAMLKAGKEVHRLHRSRTLRNPGLIVTWKEAERIGLQRRSESAMRSTVLMVTTTMLIGTGRAEAQSTSRV